MGVDYEKETGQTVGVMPSTYEGGRSWIAL
jgi:hypothetical protein